MDTVSIRELRNHGGEVIDRIAAGERLTVTRNGRPVAEIGPLRRGTPTAEALRRRGRLGLVDLDGLRADLDALADPSADSPWTS